MATSSIRSPQFVPSLFALILLISPVTSNAEHEIAFAGDLWTPYVEGAFGQDMPHGIGIDLLAALFERMDEVKFSYTVMAWRRALRDVKNGEKDGIPFLRITSEREEYMVFTDPVFSSYNLIWYSIEKFPGGFSWDDIEDLKPYRLGIIRGYSYGEKIDFAIENGHIHATDVPSINQLFTILERKRVDLVLANDAAELVLRHRGLKKIRPSVNPVDMDIYHIGISKKSAARHFIPSINKIIAEMINDGTVNRIINDKRALLFGKPARLSPLRE